MKKTAVITVSLLSLAFGSLMAPAKAVECSTPTQKNCTVTVRDKSGIKIGTQDKNSNGTTTVRDKSGIKQGTITTQPGKPSCEIIRDSRGIKVGTRGNC
jgi:hypothetical protein